MRPYASAIAWTFSPTGRSRLIFPRARGPTAIVAHVHVGQAEELAGLGGDDHRDRAVPPAGDDAAALERVEREVGGHAAGADRLGQVAVAEHHAPGDRQRLERGMHPRVRRLLGAHLVVSPEPACARERRPLGRSEVRHAKADAVRIGPVTLLLGALRLVDRHQPEV